MRSQGSRDCTGRRAPSSNFMTGASASITKPGKTPARRQSSASSNIATCDQPSVSRASAAAVERDLPRKVIPKAFTKQVAASAAAQASVAPTAGTISLGTHCGSWGLSSIAWNVSHSDTKPLKGRSEEHTSELQSRRDLVCRLLLEKKKKNPTRSTPQTRNTTPLTTAPHLPRSDTHIH